MNRARLVGAILLLMILAISPFYQGLFFPIPTMIACGLLAFGFVLWGHGRRKDRLGWGLPSDTSSLLLLVLTGAYLLQFLWAVYPQGNLEWLLRIATAYMAFTIAREESTPAMRRYFAWAMVLIVAFISLLGLLEYSGFFQNAISLASLLGVARTTAGDRIYSVLQYPNSAAALMLASLLAGHGLILTERSLRNQLLLAGLSGTIAVAFFFTLSRGVLVVAPVALLVLILGLPRRQIPLSLLLLAATIALPILVGMKGITAAGMAASPLLAILWGLIAAAAAAAAGWGALQIGKLPARTLWISLGGLVAVAVIGLSALAIARPLTEVLPASVVRLLDVSIQTQNVQARFDFAADAIRIFQDRPWGYGGGGWDRTYRRYQTVMYISRDPHNHYAQTLVEGGALGAIALVGAIGTALWVAFRNRGEDSLRWALVSGGALIAAHAVIDIDLSYQLIWLLMWMLLAVGLPPTAVHPNPQEKRYLWPVALTLSIVIGLLSFDLAAAAMMNRRAERAVHDGDGDRAVAAAKASTTLAPLNSQYLRLVSTVDNLNRAVKLDPHNSVLWHELSQRYEERGNLGEAVAAAQKALENQPMLLDRYLYLAGVLGRHISAAVTDGNREAALESAQHLLALGEQLTANSAVAAPRQHLYPTYTRLAWTPAMHLAQGKALMLLGNIQEAEERLLSVIKDPEVGSEASLWLNAIYTQQEKLEARVNLPTHPTVEALRSPFYRALVNWKS